MGGPWQVSTRGGGGVRWGRDSHELFFVEQGSEELMRVSLEVQGTGLVVGQLELSLGWSTRLAARTRERNAVK